MAKENKVSILKKINARKIHELLKGNKKASFGVVALLVALIILLVFLLFRGAEEEIVFKAPPEESKQVQEGVVKQDEEEKLPEDVHPLSGVVCESGKSASRPLAFMMAADAVTRPLSGITRADIVVEAPVVKGGITRFMGVFACEPTEETISDEIGSMRSARHDFIPIAASFDAIFGHWGGSKFALSELNKRTLDNLNALPNPYKTYYRKQGIPAPHNGFTSYKRASSASDSLGYRREYEGHKYLFTSKENPNQDSDKKKLVIEYGWGINVDYVYEAESNSYLRRRGGKLEAEFLDGSYVKPKKVIVLFVKSRMLDHEYNDLDITGSGKALIFQNGEVIEGSWNKKDKPPKQPANI